MFLYQYWLSSYILFSLQKFLTQEVEKDMKVLHNTTGPWFNIINTTWEYKQYCLEVRVTLAGLQSVYHNVNTKNSTGSANIVTLWDLFPVAPFTNIV